METPIGILKLFFQTMCWMRLLEASKKMTFHFRGCLISVLTVCIYFQTCISAEWVNEPWVVSGSYTPLQVPARSSEVCWKRWTGFTNYTTSSLIRSCWNTVCVHTDVLYVSEDHPLSRLGINHIFFAHSQSVMRFSLNLNVQTAPAELPIEPDLGSSDTKRPSVKDVSSQWCTIWMLDKKVCDFPILLQHDRCSSTGVNIKVLVSCYVLSHCHTVLPEEMVNVLINLW